ncbi:unnamed protein product [Laminaria digitata]
MAASRRADVSKEEEKSFSSERPATFARGRGSRTTVGCIARMCMDWWKEGMKRTEASKRERERKVSTVGVFGRVYTPEYPGTKPGCVGLTRAGTRWYPGRYAGKYLPGRGYTWLNIPLEGFQKATAAAAAGK